MPSTYEVSIAVAPSAQGRWGRAEGSSRRQNILAKRNWQLPYATEFAPYLKTGRFRCLPHSLTDEDACRIAGRLDAAPVTFLWDHLVAGRSILPGAGMMEFTAANGQALAFQYMETSQSRIGFSQATIPAAVMLTASPATAPVLESVTDLRAGSIEIGNYPIGKPQGKLWAPTLSI